MEKGKKNKGGGGEEDDDSDHDGPPHHQFMVGDRRLKSVLVCSQRRELTSC